MSHVSNKGCNNENTYEREDNSEKIQFFLLRFRYMNVF